MEVCLRLYGLLLLCGAGSAFICISQQLFPYAAASVVISNKLDSLFAFLLPFSALF